MALLQRGDFVRVKATSDFRPDQDGMVIAEEIVRRAIVRAASAISTKPVDIGLN